MVKLSDDISYDKQPSKVKFLEYVIEIATSVGLQIREYYVLMRI